MKKRMRIVFATLFLLLAAASVSALAAGLSGAVIVGVADYKAINDLTYTVNDANDIYNKCIEYGLANKQVKLLVDKKASKSAIEKAIGKMAKKVEPNEVYLFFFSGHGSYHYDQPPIDEADGYDEYIIPYDGQFSSPGSWIRDDELEQWLGPILDQGGKVVVILDTCFAGGAIKGAVPGKGGKEAACKCLAGPAGKATAKGVHDGYSKDLDRYGFVVLMACDDNELSYEYPWFQNGVFSFLIDIALGGPADDLLLPGGIGNDSQKIDTDELFYAVSALSQYSSLIESACSDVLSCFGQTPQFYGSGEALIMFEMR